MFKMLNLEFLTPTSMVIISLSTILLCGYLATRITKKLGLPNVTAYIVTGIIIGPYIFNIIPESFVQGTAFLPDIALSFIAFSTGQFFRLETLKKGGVKILIITIFEALMAFVLVFIMSYFVLGLQLSFSLVLAALATATAPASTMMTIRQTKASGDFVDTLLQVVALDDLIALLSYSVAVAICKSINTADGFDLIEVVLPIVQNLIAIIGGAIFGLFIKIAIRQKGSSDNRLIIALALLFGYCGLCTVFDISPLLGCMMMAAVYINITDDNRLFKQLNYFSPPILLLFFVRSGINFNISTLLSSHESIGKYPLILVGIMYFVVRIMGKYLGSYFGAKITGQSEAIQKYLGLALFPQAGVAIGLAALGARVIGGHLGEALNTVIMTSSILYELIGPICAKMALQLSGSFPEKEKEVVSEEVNENEIAYNEAIDEQHKD